MTDIGILQRSATEQDFWTSQRKSYKDRGCHSGIAFSRYHTLEEHAYITLIAEGIWVSDLSFTFFRRSVTSTAELSNEICIRGVWLDFACATSVAMRVGSSSGTDLRALRVRTNALFCMVGFVRVERLSCISRSVAKISTSTFHKGEEVKPGEDRRHVA